MNVRDSASLSECFNCGYNLASGEASVLATCPECGTAAPKRWQADWSVQMERFGLTLALWGLGVFAVAGVLDRRGILNVGVTGSAAETWNLSRAMVGVVELAAVMLVIVGYLCLRRSSTGDRFKWWAIGVAAVLAVIEFGTAMQSSGIYPWNAPGERNSWMERIRSWITSGAYAGLGALLMVRVASILGRYGLPTMARWAPRVAIAMLVAGVIAPIVDGIGREIWSQWTASAALPITTKGVAGQPGMPPVRATPPWYARSNAIVLVFWLTPLKAGVIATAWAFVLIARVRLGYMMKLGVGAVDTSDDALRTTSNN